MIRIILTILISGCAKNINNIGIINKGINEDLIKTIEEGDINNVVIALSNGANVNFKSYYGRTALIYASINGYTEIVKILIENGADINAKKNN